MPEQPSTQALWLMSNFCQFPALTAKKSAWYMLILCRFLIIFPFSPKYFCGLLSEFFSFAKCGPTTIRKYFYLIFLTTTTALLPFERQKNSFYSTFSAEKWIFRISRFSDLKILCFWVWKEVKGKL